MLVICNIDDMNIYRDISVCDIIFYRLYSSDLQCDGFCSIPWFSKDE